MFIKRRKIVVFIYNFLVLFICSIYREMAHVSDRNLESNEESSVNNLESNKNKELQPKRNISEKNINDIRFQDFDEITTEKINRIFSNGMDLVSPDEQGLIPYFILLIGSPGVGKTNMINKYITDKLKRNKDNFYKISLDLILEKITPFREATIEIYNKLKPGEREKKTEEINVTFNKKQYGLLNFSTIYQTSYKNFNITSKKMEKLAEINSLPIPPASNKNRPKKSIVGNIAEDSIQTFSDIADESIRYAIKKRFNIIYDTTITPTFSKILNIMKMLEEEYQDGQNKYKIKVVLIKAEGETEEKKNNIEKQTEQISKQINRRHRNMIHNGYIRTIRKSLIPTFIKDNRSGFDNAIEYFKTNGYEKREIPKTYKRITKNMQNKLFVQNPKYKSTDITFIDETNIYKKNNKTQNNRNIVNQFKQLSLKSNNK